MSAPSGLALCCLQGLVNPEGDAAYYDLLHVERKATAAQIKKSFRRQSLEMHPDKLRQHGKVATPEDVERFRRVKEAYEVLSDPQRRKVYDRLGPCRRRGGAASPGGARAQASWASR